MQTIINQNVTLSYKICLINYFKLFEMQPLIQKTNNKSNDVNSLWQHGNKLSPLPTPPFDCVVHGSGSCVFARGKVTQVWMFSFLTGPLSLL